jgi:replicative DNA helicase
VDASRKAVTVDSASALDEYTELAVLSAIMQHGAAIMAVRSTLRCDHFSSDRLRRIYSAMLAVADRGAAPDPVTVAWELRQRGELEVTGGHEFLTEVTGLIPFVPENSNVAYHAGLVVDRALGRMATRVLDGAQQSLAAGTARPGDLVRDLTRLVASVESSSALPTPVSALAPVDDELLEFVVDEIWPAGEPGVIAGDGGSFKSSNALVLVGAGAGGYRVWNRFQTRQRKALIVSAEDSRAVIVMRLEAIVRGFGWDRERVLGNIEILAAENIALDDPRWRAHINQTVERLDAGYLLIDPWADVLGDKDENRNSDIRPIVGYLRGLATRMHGAVIIVHHMTKQPTAAAAKQSKPAKQKTADRVRGATAFINAMRTALYLEDTPAGVRVEHFKANRTEKLSEFLLSRAIASEPGNRLRWISAQFFYTSDTEAKTREAAEIIVLDLVTKRPGEFNSTKLREAAEQAGVRKEEASAAIAKLSASGKIAADTPKGNTKLWRLSEPAQLGLGKLGRLEKEGLPNLPNARAGTSGQPAGVPAPLQGQANTPPPEAAGRLPDAADPHATSTSDDWTPDDSQRAVMDQERA